MRQLHWDQTAIWRAGIDKIKTHIQCDMRMIDLDEWLRSMGCKLGWDCNEKRLQVVPCKEVIHAKPKSNIKFSQE
jgi:hypothetical protein